MNEIEIRARQIAAQKMSLVDDPTGSRLPTNLWKQCEAAARLEELLTEKNCALGQVLGMIDAVLLAGEHPTVFDLPKMMQKLRVARDAYNVAAAAYLDARLTS